MKVRTKLIIGFTVIVVLLWMVTIFAGNNFGRLKSQFSVVEERVLHGTFTAQQMEEIAGDIHGNVMTYVLYNVSGEKESAISQIESLQQMSSHYLPPAVNVNLDEYRESSALVLKVNTFIYHVRYLLNMKEAGANSAGLLAYDLDSSFPALLDLQQSVDQEINRYAVELSTAKADFNTAYSNGVNSLILSAVLMTLLAVGTAISTTRGIVKPLHALHKGTEMIALGNLDYKVGTGAEDEIGQLSRAFDDMTQKLSRSVTSIDRLNLEIAERRHAETALKDSEEKFRNLFEQARDAIILADTKTGIIVDVNQAAANLLGMPREKIIGLHQSKIHPPDKVEIYKKLFKEHAKKGTVISEELIIQHSDGRTIPVNISTSIVNMGGKTILQGVFRDVTERNRMEKALRESEEKFSKAFHAIPEAVSISTLGDGTFLEVNESYTRITGYSRGELIFQNADKFNMWADPGQRDTMLDKIRRRVRIHNEEMDFRTKSGKIRTMVISTEFIQIAGQACLLVVSSDITDRKRIEQALKESEEKFSKAFNAGPQQIVITRAKDNVTLDVNDSFIRTTGFTHEETIGRTAEELGVWTTLQDSRKMQRMLKKQGQIINEEFEYFNKSGEKHTELLSIEPITIGDEQCWISIMTDITERKQMEEALANEAIWRRLLIEQSRDGIVILDNDGKVFETNLRFAEMIGYSHEEVMQLHVWDWEFQLEHERVLDMIRTVDETGDHFETRHLRKDGTTFDVEISTNGAIIAGQKLIFCVCRDTTERKQIEKALRESEEKFSVAFRHSPEMIAIANMKDGNYVDVNDSYIRSTGYTREEIVGHPVSAINMWVYPEESEKMTRLLMEQGKVANEEYTFSMKSGEIRQWLCSAETITIAGDPCIISVATDITERKRMEKYLKESEEKFSTAFHAIPESVSISTKKDGIFIDVNDTFLYQNGLTREQVIGHSAKDLKLWAQSDERNKMQKMLQERGHFENEEFEFSINSGEIHTVLLSADTINLKDEPCLLVIGNDITRRKQAEENLKKAMADIELSSARLKTANKELESFSYSVSHDLRSPLRSIDGFSQALLEDYSSKIDETGKDYLNRLRTASQKMGELIDGLLKLSRLTRSEMHREKVDLSALAEEISTRLKETHRNQKAEFVIEGGLVADGDPQMLRVMLENLLGNAWKFTRKTPLARIEFGSAANGKKKTFFIKDNGAGFDMSYRDKLFGAFQRLHDSTDFPGTGIGLATVQRIVNRHGGSVKAEGAVDKGATFYFTLS